MFLSREVFQMTDKVPMTVAGHTALEEEFKNLKTVERPSIIKAIAEAREHGDLSENAEYHAARERQSFVEGRIQELESKLGRAEVIDISKLSGDTVMFGVTIKLIDEDSEEEVTYHIVGEDESNIKNGQLSITSPLARALIGKKVEDSAEVPTPKGVKSYEILEIAFK